MSKYGLHASNFVTTTGVKTAMLLEAISNRRAEIVELVMSGAGQAAPADVQHQATAAYTTKATLGAGTNVTAEKMSGQGAAAAGSSPSRAFTVEPTTYSAVFPVNFGFNQRGGQRWAVPQGEGLKVDSAATAMRLGWRVQSSVAGAVDGMMNFWED